MQNHGTEQTVRRTLVYIIRAETRRQSFALFNLNKPAYPNHPTVQLRLHKLQGTESSSSQAARIIRHPMNASRME